MVQATSTQIYNPPALPDYLKNVYNLKPIVGAPNDDDVKGIHAVIRAAQTVAQVPGIISLDLSISLAQHLFEVQMARYRDRYPCGAFPEDTAHTPPTLPSHVSITLEPVTGAPSDEEIQSVYTAIRTYEQMAVVPSMFDPNVGMELSQHLFNIQFARYMSQASQGKLGSNSKSPKKDDITSSTRTQHPIDSAQDLSDEEPTEVLREAADGGSTNPRCPSSQAEAINDETPLQTTPSGSAEIFQELLDTLKDIKRVIITAQQGQARVARGTHYSKGCPTGLQAQELMNDKGELPSSQRPPTVGRDSWRCNYGSILNDSQLAQYLQFYSIGNDLLQEDTPVIRDGQRGNAEALLTAYLSL